MKPSTAPLASPRSGVPQAGDVTLAGICRTLAQQELRTRRECAARLDAQQAAFLDRLAEGADNVFALQRALASFAAFDGRTSPSPAEGHNPPPLHAVHAAARRLQRWLADLGVQIDDPSGRPLDEALHPLVEVLDWGETGGDFDTVRETIRPVLRLRDGRIRPGQVIGRPAAPAPTREAEP